MINPSFLRINLTIQNTLATRVITSVQGFINNDPANDVFFKPVESALHEKMFNIGWRFDHTDFYREHMELFEPVEDQSHTLTPDGISAYHSPFLTSQKKKIKAMGNSFISSMRSDYKES